MLVRRCGLPAADTHHCCLLAPAAAVSASVVAEMTEQDYDKMYEGGLVDEEKGVRQHPGMECERATDSTNSCCSDGAAAVTCEALPPGQTI